MYRRTERGFSIIELLIVIAILGTLSAVVIFSLTTARNKSKYARARADIDHIIKASMMAQGTQGTMIAVTGSGCSDCSCRSGNMRNVSASHACYVAWSNALNNIASAAGQEFATVVALTRDPWGSPYCLDENEREGGPTNCSADTLRSLGPNGLYGDSDDVSTVIPNSSPCP